MKVKKDKITKNKKKKQKRKEEYISFKKIQNEQRQKVIQSLVEHNKNEGKYIEQLSSAKMIGIKRKKSPIKQNIDYSFGNDDNKGRKKINKTGGSNCDIECDGNVDIDEGNLSSSSFSSVSMNRGVCVEEKELTINNIPQEPKPIDPKLQQMIIAKIHEARERERLAEEIEEMKGIVYEEGKVLLPKESDLILPNRNENINISRKLLPIIRQEHDIMYAIDNSLVTIICGETGSGKSTQIPQFIYEKGYTKAIGKIGITQPRRVAARALAQRVSEELNVQLGQEVGYQIRYESDYISNNTIIKFFTDGILLKELESDQLLSQYSVIIIDEAHERTINTDLLIGFLSQIIKIRFALWKKGASYVNGDLVLPLRLVIMSATLRVEEFTNSKNFLPRIEPRVVEVSARQFPVNIYHSKKTSEDYIGEAFKLCCKIHRRLPDGNVIVFLTGKREIIDLCWKLKQEFEKEPNDNIDQKDEALNNPKKYLDKVNNNQEKTQEQLEEEQQILNEVDNNNNNEDTSFAYKPVVVLPLYSSMSPEDQMKIYQDYQSKRMIIIATNVAETSLTIPNVRYVVDSGRVKKRIYKAGLSFSTFSVQWTSQASANQRSGRAGRTCAGFCYRLYSNGLYVKMEKFTEPQISSCPLNQVILMLKSMNVSNILKFPFISKPNPYFLDKAIEHLIVIGALDSNSDDNNLRIKNIAKYLMNESNPEALNEEEEDETSDTTTINDLGRLMIKFPIEPKLAKMLIMSNSYSLVEYMIIIVSFMSIENPFDLNMSYKDLIDNYKLLQINNDTSDIITYLNLIIVTLKTKQSLLQMNKRKLDEIHNLSTQLCSICSRLFGKTIKLDYSNMELPTSENQGILMQIFLCGFIDNIARKKTLYDIKGNQLDDKEQVLKKKVIYESNENNFECKMHPLSVLNGNLPEYVIYKEIIKDQNSYLVCNSAIKPEWLYNMGGSLIKETLAMDFKEPFYNKKTSSIYCFVNLVYGYKQWDIPHVIVEMKKNNTNYYRYMARFLLEGELLDVFKEFIPKLNSNANIITNKFSDMYVKVNRLVNSLQVNSIDSKEQLAQKLRKDRNYLKEIVLMWYDDIPTRNKIKLNWPFIK